MEKRRTRALFVRSRLPTPSSGRRREGKSFSPLISLIRLQMPLRRMLNGREGRRRREEMAWAT